MNDEQCFFVSTFKCENKTEPLSDGGPARIQNFIKHSKIYGDRYHEVLEEKISENPEWTVKCHRNCASTYTSSIQVKRHKRKNPESPSPYILPKTRKRSSLPAFIFNEHCLFCGETCVIEKDPKHPKRWRPAYPCRKIGDASGKKSLKETILKACDRRQDELSENVRQRVHSTVSDLHAADARYHVDCRNSFLSEKNLASAASKSDSQVNIDQAFESLVAMVKDSSTFLNSVELLDAYKEFGGDGGLTRRLLILNLCERFGDELVVLKSPGLTDIVCLRSVASKCMRLVQDEDDDMDVVVNKLSKAIRNEIKEITLNKNCYDSGINRQKCGETVSNTLMKLLGKLSPKLDNTLPAILIGSVVTGVMKNHPTSLQISLGIKMRISKKLVQLLQKYGVTCTYDEVLRFKHSAAKATTMKSSLPGLSTSSESLVQVIVDNFDTDIASQNGKSSTHSLAMLLTQPESNSESETVHGQGDTICRVEKDDMGEPLKYDVEVQRYNGPKKPPMPQNNPKRSVQPLRVLAQQAISQRRASEMDFAFLQDMVNTPDCPEYNGYNTRAARRQGQSPQPNTKAVYLPLIDMIPSHPDTMMTAMAFAQVNTRNIGQQFVVFTCDLQLYRVALEVQWTYPERFSNVILRLGGMHSLMSFIGSIGTLMADTGLSDIMSAVFGGVSKMLTGKKYPQNVRALRMVAEEALRRIIQDKPLDCSDDLAQILENEASKSQTTKLWVDVLIKPVLLTMMFVRAEREGDWPLHLATYKQMMPYFFGAGHVNYARYGLCYLREMERLPEEVLLHFMKGEHVMHHSAGLWNGIWSDMMIETTFMRYGHSPGGIIGITLKPETLKVWALSLHACSRLESDLDEMTDEDTQSKVVTTHKEEAKARIAEDKKDRDGIRQKLDTCIDPLDSAAHPSGIVNVVSGQIGASEVNVHNVVTIGTEQMIVFESQLPEGLYETISKKVVTMDHGRKHVKVAAGKVFDTNLIYSRVIGLQASGRDIDIKDVLGHELAPVPTSMFDDTGDMRIAKSKSTLKKILQVDVSDRVAGGTNISVLDGSAILWVVPWPADGTVKDYIANFKYAIGKRLLTEDVYLIFDRYYDYSTKSVTRGSRATGVSRVHHLQVDSKLPAQKIVLASSQNKKQLMQLIVDDLVQDKKFHEDNTQHHKLVVTGQDPVPIEISEGGVVISRADLATSHEEADIIIVQQVLSCVAENSESNITIVADDTDVFVLMLHYYHMANLKNIVLMESPIKGRTVVHIGKTVQKHSEIIEGILPAHALSGCDTVASYFGIGKATVLKMLRSGHSLDLLGAPGHTMESVIQQATCFISACYGQTNCSTMSEARLKVWLSKTGKGLSTPKLCTLPPTTDAFKENVKRAHHQALVWSSLREPNPPELDSTEYGWVKNDQNATLQPVTLPDEVELAPEMVLRLLKCGCHSTTPCSSRACSCNTANMKCTLFCACYNQGCCNPTS